MTSTSGTTSYNQVTEITGVRMKLCKCDVVNAGAYTKYAALSMGMHRITHSDTKSPHT